MATGVMKTDTRLRHLGITEKNHKEAGQREGRRLVRMSSEVKEPHDFLRGVMEGLAVAKMERKALSEGREEPITSEMKRLEKKLDKEV